jgi:hypothetical protein
LVLLGAGRGGTTLLYKLLAMHPQVGYLSNFLERAPAFPALAVLHRALRGRYEWARSAWFKPEGGAYLGGHDRRLSALVPTPAEGEAVYRHCGVPLFPDPDVRPDAAACARLRQRFESVRRAAGATVMVAKRTANNRRIPWLEAAWPDVRYVHLLRDGRAVAHSLVAVHWWSDHRLFWAGKTPRELAREGHDELDLAARNWVEEVDLIERGLRVVPATRIREVRYEQLMLDPMRTLREVLAFGGLDPDPDPGYAGAVGSLNLAPKAEAWQRRWTPEQLGRVEAIQSRHLARWHYS